MPEYLSPGVYVEEIPSGNRPIEGVSTSVAGMVGMTQRGPVGAPVLVTSFGAFTRQFGAYLDHRVYTLSRDALPYAVEGFFANGGTKTYIVRVVGPAARFAEATLFGITRTDPATTALAANVAAGLTEITVDNPDNIAAEDVLMLIDDTRTERVTVAETSAPNPVGIRLNRELEAAHSAGDPVTVITITEDAARNVVSSMNAGATVVALANPNGLSANTWLRIRDTGNPTRTEFVQITTANAADIIPPLRYDHPFHTTEVHVVSFADGAATLLTNAQTAGDTLLALDDPTVAALQADALVRIGTAPGELHVVAAVYATVTVSALAETHLAGTPVVKVVEVMTVYARHQGRWANTLRVRTRRAIPLETTTVSAAAAGSDLLQLETTVGMAAGSVFDVTTTAGTDRYIAATVNTTTNEVTLTQELVHAVAPGNDVEAVAFDLIVEYLENDRVVNDEVIEAISLSSENPRFVETAVGRFDEATGVPEDEGESDLVRVARSAGADADAELAIALTLPVGDLNVQLADGDDDLAGVDANAYIGQAAIDPEDRTGIQSLANIDEISIIAAPGQTGIDVQNALIVHAEQMRYRFAVLDSREGDGLRDVQRHRSLYDTTRGAYYYPWLQISDRFVGRGAVLNIPPSGHIIGVYARTDTSRGVWKAPANEMIQGIRGLQVNLTRGEQDILNPRHINCQRNFQDNNRGIRVWGARTLSSDPEWRYINVRRLFLMVEKSIERGMQWAVFEPNDMNLWAAVRRSVNGFLNTLWRDGALEGAKPEEAFFVRADRTTMTQDDIDNGRLIVLVGIAPVKPAEFVIFRISHKTREAES